MKTGIRTSKNTSDHLRNISKRLACLEGGLHDETTHDANTNSSPLKICQLQRSTCPDCPYGSWLRMQRRLHLLPYVRLGNQQFGELCATLEGLVRSCD